MTVMYKTCTNAISFSKDHLKYESPINPINSKVLTMAHRLEKRNKSKGNSQSTASSRTYCFECWHSSHCNAISCPSLMLFLSYQINMLYVPQFHKKKNMISIFVTK